MKLSFSRFGLLSAATLWLSLPVYADTTTSIQLDTTPPPQEGALTPDQTPPLSNNAPATSAGATPVAPPTSEDTMSPEPAGNPGHPTPAE